MRHIFFILLGASLLYPGFLAAQDSVKVTGVVKQFDVNVGVITIRPNRKGATEDESYSLLNKEIEVTTVAGEKTRLDAVAPGQTVQLTIRPSGDVAAIVVQPYVFLATVSDVDAKNRTIALAREEKRTTTMAVAADAKVLLAGRTAYLREVKPGSQMSVTASLDGKTVLGLKLVSDPDGKLAAKLYPRIKISKLPGIKWVGVLTDVDAAKSELQLTGPKTKGVPRPMPVAKDAVIQVMYGQVAVQTVTLNQFMKSAHATVLVSPQNEQITRILVEPPALHGKVKTLDADGGQLTVEVDGIAKIFALQKGFKVMYGTRVMRLADLQPNVAVTLVLSLDREQLLAVDIR
jgi:hypothetical protein